MRAALADLALYQEILTEWAFRGTDDLGVLAALLNEQGLSAAQLQGLLPRLGLSAEALAVLLGELDSDSRRTCRAGRGAGREPARGAGHARAHGDGYPARRHEHAHVVADADQNGHGRSAHGRPFANGRRGLSRTKAGANGRARPLPRA